MLQVAAAAAAAAAAAPAPVASAACGSVVGAWDNRYGTVASFRGIPYGAPTGACAMGTLSRVSVVVGVRSQVLLFFRKNLL